MEPQEFSIRSRARSFIYAMGGILRFIRMEHNARLHVVATVAVIVAAVACKVTHGEAIALTFAVGLVWVTEMLNTCVERILDFISREIHPQIKFIKDLAAGAVLVASLAALVVGAIIFIPKFL
ncbi:MAG: diacylglycerol kinase family protein [Bacteroidota bacterium]|nr:diacylglycerol kinase family protein [Bacteroidota bacterium]MDP4214849.1 diacylglycerol kinase family protein [Bacteroidota bacterium]MDP4248192.1 diacylglycerol kinase family protein [Bacteroidota bacterium]MDP4252959.1 diacylglycerol kinase family protein [Bacteroidota bacterium]MDP4259047.1 diacylglycerol kinase family protein [Bacteroidota bacterium]